MIAYKINESDKNRLFYIPNFILALFTAQSYSDKP